MYMYVCMYMYMYVCIYIKRSRMLAKRTFQIMKWTDVKYPNWEWY